MPAPAAASVRSSSWFTVSYRSVRWRASLVLIGARRGAAWYCFFYAPEQATAGSAETPSPGRRSGLHRSRAATRPPEHLDEVACQRRAALAEGRDCVQRRQYDDAAQSPTIRVRELLPEGDRHSHGEGRPSKESGSTGWRGRPRASARASSTGTTADQEDDPARWGTRSRRPARARFSSSTSTATVDDDPTRARSLEIERSARTPRRRSGRSAKLNWGEVLASTQKTNVDGSFHEVATDESARARSDDAGEFRVSSDKRRQTASVDVFHGRVQIASGGRVERLGSGERIRARRRGQAPGERDRCRACPALIAPAGPEDLRPRGPVERRDHASRGRRSRAAAATTS